jgi:ribose transport system permease protein
VKNNLTVKKSLNYLKALLLPAVVFLLFFAISGGRFGAGSSLLNLTKQCVYPTLIAWAAYNTMILGVWDFSIGSVMALSIILSVGLTKTFDLGMWGMIILIIVFCVIMDIFNFTVFHYFKIPSIISNIGMMMIYESIGCSIFNGKATVPREWTFWAKAPYAYIILAIAFVVLYLLINHTKYGYNIRSIGNGKTIALNIGVSLKMTRLKSFLVQGIVLGIATVVFLSYQGSLSASMNAASSSTAFSAILAVFIGLYLSKYCNVLLGIFIGTYTIKMLSAGIIAVGLNDTWQTVAIGVFLVIFLGFAKNQNIIYVLMEKRKLRKTMLKAQNK